MSSHPLEELFHPQSIAVVGASPTPESQGYSYTDALIKAGFRGAIYPVNPKYQEILGLKAYAKVSDIPGPVDYVISSVPAPQVPAMIEDCGGKGVKVIHLYTARFSETGRKEAIELEREVLRLARKHGIRLIGPNCMGLYYPKQGIAFWANAVQTTGPVGLISQSGQMVGEITGTAALRGVYFSKAISYGNAIDLNECDYLEYLSQDPDTEIILMYVEGLRNGRKFFDILRRTTPHKPVIILKGGRGRAGARATASHTASLAGSTQMWKTALAQAGGVSADSVAELIDLAVAFRFLPPLVGKRVAVGGGAGGASVVAADECEEAGLDVAPLSDEFREDLKRRGISIWDWIGNPADMSIREDRAFSIGDLFALLAPRPDYDLLILQMGGGPPGRGRWYVSVDDYLKQYKLDEIRIKPLLAVLADQAVNSDNYDDESMKLVYELRKRLPQLGIPFYPTVGRAAKAASKMVDYYQRRNGVAIHKSLSTAIA